MANRHEIELFINDDGELKVHIKGMKGPGCMKTLESLTKDIGTVQEKNLSAEYYETPAAQVNPQSKIKDK
ncbi:MAG: DUF2997 domain-containing protein [Candidatus Omnitrophica bacterium]|nr:DUF2997 domain-containing protein [Candidatus Omnitrophota bacterium]